MKVVLRIPALFHLHQVARIPPEVVEEIQPEGLVGVPALMAAQHDVGIVVIGAVDGAGAVAGRVGRAAVFCIHLPVEIIDPSLVRIRLHAVRRQVAFARPGVVEPVGLVLQLQDRAALRDSRRIGCPPVDRAAVTVDLQQ
jgi:hypothetical protein